MPRLVSHPDEVKIVSRRFGKGAENIDRYLELGGYEAAKKCLAQGPDWIINEMKASQPARARRRGLSHRHEVVVRAQAVRQAQVRSRQWRRKRAGHLQRSPDLPARSARGHRRHHHCRPGHRRQDWASSICAASIAICSKSWRRPSPTPTPRAFWAKTSSAPTSNFEIITQTGAGAYEVGEESALMESLEGKRGIPRIKPPFPAVVGLYGGPTVINNAETIATVPHVIAMGAAGLCKLGTPRNGGTRLFCISGHVERPGVYELPMGYNLKKMIYEVGGGIRGGRKLKAVVPGGSSTPVLLPEEIDIGMDFDQVGKAGSMLGSGGVVVIDDQTCMVEFALRTISFYQHESCGWCIPCREGTDWLKKSLTRFHAGFGEAKDIDNIRYLAENMLGRTFCPLGDAAAMPTIAFVKKFRKEFEDHLTASRALTHMLEQNRNCAG